MDSQRLLECLDADYVRLRDVVGAAQLTTTVPSCPDWTVGELTLHVGGVYHHKAACMGAEPRGLLESGYAQLTEEFAARAPESPTYTWYEPDQTVGFWIRRMAQETVIHRVDAELAVGVPVTTIPADLAADGIDEFLVAFVEYGSRTSPEDFEVLSTADGQAVRVETPDAAWLVRPVRGGSVEVSPAGSDAGVAVVRGEPADLLLWLWNRTGDEAVTISGDADAVAYLRKVLAAAAA